MGMFDSMYDRLGTEWQTKAFHCELDRYRVGDELPFIGTDTYQVEIFGGPNKPSEYIEALATVRGNKLASIRDERDETLPLLDYHGEWIAKEEA
jgi:hypothetical protein